MPTNYIKTYNSFLELVHLSEKDRRKSLKSIFDRDITNNAHFKFRTKTIRPLKKEGLVDMEVLFSHLTNKSTQTSNKVKSRTYFDNERSKRLHWLWHHIQEKSENIVVFSFEDRIRGKNEIRTYIYDEKESYVIILQPQRSKLDYYLLTAYHLTKELGGLKQMKRKYENKLDEVY